MPLTCAFIMDPITDIHFHKDTSIAIMLEAQRRNWPVYILTMDQLFVRHGTAYGHMHPIVLHDTTYRLQPKETRALGTLDCIFMRKDPPVDQDYWHATQLLDMAQRQGARVLNRPQSLRDCNEKLLITQFPTLIPETLVSAHAQDIHRFIHEQGKAVLKPLDGMGGQSVFALSAHDVNIPVVIETLTKQGQRLIMAQQFLPEIHEHGDKRILLIDGEPFPYGLLRMPQKGEFRGNLAAGGHSKGFALTPKDHAICQHIGPTLRDLGLFFVGIDVIGGYLTEINITSPTCVRQIDADCHTQFCAVLLDHLEQTMDHY